MTQRYVQAAPDVSSVPPDPREGAVQASDVRCPLCGATVKWSCHTGVATGKVDCQNGLMVSRRLPNKGAACMWAGTVCYRVKDETVCVDMPLPTEVFPF